MKTSPPLNPLPQAPAACCGHPLFRLENLYRAYWACRKRKRGTANALTFETDLEANLLELHARLSDGTYRPRPAIAFLVEKLAEAERRLRQAGLGERDGHRSAVGIAPVLSTS